MQWHASLAAHLRCGLDILQDTGLVISVHERDQHGAVENAGANLRRIDQPIARGRQIAHTKAFLLQASTAIEHRFMFGTRGEHVCAAFSSGARGAEYREIIGFRRP
jgi:hypothetical protein